MTRREFLASPLGGLLPWSWFRRDAALAGIRFRQLRRGAPRRHYLHIHGNERTAFDVLSQHMESAEGRAFFVRSTQRYVALLDGKIDPNRMFSRAGAERNLRALNPRWDARRIERALRRLDGGREDFLRHLLPPRGALLVALHNNGAGYSVKDEIPISDAAALNDPEHPHEFLLCTARPDFELLAGGRFNVVLQNRAPKEDDGSLSRLCAARGVRYVNIEAAHGNAESQRRMLAWVEALL